MDRQHRLVKAWDNQPVGSQKLTRYRFRHILFQQYLYDNLDKTERAYLHGDVGNELAELYAEQSESIAPQLARQRCDLQLELTALMAQVTLYVTFTPVYDPQRAGILAERALVLARDLDNQTAEARIMWAMLFVYQTTNRLDQAIESGQRSLALARKLNLRNQMAYTLNDLRSHSYLVNGLLTGDC